VDLVVALPAVQPVSPTKRLVGMDLTHPAAILAAQTRHGNEFQAGEVDSALFLVRRATLYLARARRGSWHAACSKEPRFSRKPKRSSLQLVLLPRQILRLALGFLAAQLPRDRRPGLSSQ
jgi:hypothetical protein